MEELKLCGVCGQNCRADDLECVRADVRTAADFKPVYIEFWRCVDRQACETARLASDPAPEPLQGEAAILSTLQAILAELKAMRAANQLWGIKGCGGLLRQSDGKLFKGPREEMEAIAKNPGAVFPGYGSEVWEAVPLGSLSDID